MYVHILAFLYANKILLCKCNEDCIHVVFVCVTCSYFIFYLTKEDENKLTFRQWGDKTWLP